MNDNMVNQKCQSNIVMLSAEAWLIVAKDQSLFLLTFHIRKSTHGTSIHPPEVLKTIKNNEYKIVQ